MSGFQNSDFSVCLKIKITVTQKNSKKKRKCPKKGKTKGRSISNVKKSNIKQNKLIKAGKAKPKSNPHFVEGGKYRNKTKQGALTPEQLLKRQEYEDEKKKNVSF